MRAEWRKLHNEELHGVYCLSNNTTVTKSSKMRWVSHVAYMAEATTLYKTFPQKTQSRRPFGKSRHVWVDDTKVCPKELLCGSVECGVWSVECGVWSGCSRFGRAIRRFI
jgi:hypothetical protein